MHGGGIATLIRNKLRPLSQIDPPAPTVSFPGCRCRKRRIAPPAKDLHFEVGIIRFSKRDLSTRTPSASRSDNTRRIR
jgi:hypothetical protein